MSLSYQQVFDIFEQCKEDKFAKPNSELVHYRILSYLKLGDIPINEEMFERLLKLAGLSYNRHVENKRKEIFRSD